MFGAFRGSAGERATRQTPARRSGTSRWSSSDGETRDCNSSGPRRSARRVATCCGLPAIAHSRSPLKRLWATRRRTSNNCAISNDIIRTRRRRVVAPSPFKHSKEASPRGHVKDSRRDKLNNPSLSECHARGAGCLESTHSKRGYFASRADPTGKTSSDRQTTTSFGAPLIELCSAISSLTRRNPNRVDQKSEPVIAFSLIHWLAIVLLSWQRFLPIQQADCVLASISPYPNGSVNRTDSLLPKIFQPNLGHHQAEFFNATSGSSQWVPKSALMERRNFGQRIPLRDGDSFMARLMGASNPLNESHPKVIQPTLSGQMQYPDAIKHDYDIISLHKTSPSNENTISRPARARHSNNGTLFTVQSKIRLAANDSSPARPTSETTSDVDYGFGNHRASAANQSAGANEENRRHLIVISGDQDEPIYGKPEHSLAGASVGSAHHEAPGQESLSIGILIRPEASLDAFEEGGQLESAKDYQVVELESPSNSSSRRFPMNESRQLMFYQAASAPRVYTNSSSRVNYTEPDWQASDIEQVIKVKKDDHDIQYENEKKAGGQEELKKGKSDKRVHGERLRDKEEKAHWKKEKHGEEQHKASGKKDAAAEAKWLKDLGHNKHGWKNVYHKEEYANHQKYHDVLRDKNWDNKKAKAEENHHFEKGNKFKDSQRKDFYDKDKHGSKYDYSKGNEWKRYEDEQYDGGQDDDAKEVDDAVQSGEKAHEQGSDWHHAPTPKKHPAQATVQSHVQRDGHSDGSEEPFVGPLEASPSDDEDVIEQMKNKLERLSEAKSISDSGEKYKASPSNFVQGPHLPVLKNQTFQTGSLQADSSAESDNETPDYDNEWNPDSQAAASAGGQLPASPAAFNASHQSINDILKTAKQVNQSTAQGSPEQDRNRNQQDYGGRDDDEEDNENEPDQEIKQPIKDGRKNELRLKLELDLGKSLAGPKETHGNQSGSVAGTGSGYAGGASKRKPKADGNDSAKSWSSREKRPPQAGSNSGWKPRDVNNDVGSARQQEAGYTQDLQRGIENVNPLRGEAQSEHDQLDRGHDRRQASAYGGPRASNKPGGQLRAPASGAGSPRHRKHSALLTGATGPQSSQSGLGGISELKTLAQVMPSRPIFVKHLQMNGGIVLGKLNGVSSNRSSLIERHPAPLRRPVPHPAPFIESMPTGGQPIMSDDMSIETSLANALSDQHEHVLGVPQLHNMNPLSAVQAHAIESLIRQQQVATATRQPVPSNKEFMVLFGNQQAGAGAQAQHQPREARHFGDSQQLMEPAEPNVIFETSASTMDEDRQPYLSDSYQQLHQQQQINSLLFSVIRDDERQLLAPGASPAATEGVLRRPLNNPGMAYQTSGGKHMRPMRARPAIKIPNLLRIASVNYTLLGGAGKGATGGSFGPASVQQTLGRFLRLPRRVFRPTASPQQQPQPDESRLKLMAAEWSPLAQRGGRHLKPFRDFRALRDLAQQQYLLADSVLALDPLMEAGSSQQPKLVGAAYKLAAPNSGHSEAC